MKKLCLAVVFSVLLISSNAKADRYADFVRVECNKTFGFFDIQYHSMTGEKIVDFFYSPTPYFKYSIYDNVLESEIYFINNFYESRKPFVLECEFRPLWQFIIEIDKTDRGECQGATNNIISVTEKSREKMGEELIERKLVDRVSMGCEGKVNRIVGTDDSYSFGKEWNRAVHLDFVYNMSEVSFYRFEQNKTITDEVIDEKIDEKKKRSAELERRQEERRKETAKLLGQYEE